MDTKKTYTEAEKLAICLEEGRAMQAGEKKKTYLTPAEIQRAIEILHPHNELFEVRILCKRGRKRTLSGYFTSGAKLVEELKKQETAIVRDSGTVYITLQEMNRDLYSRVQHDHFEESTDSTADKHITAYKWLFIDLDPERLAGISSTDDEFKEAYTTAQNVKKYMSAHGFTDPVEASSGNGFHLLYRIDIPNILDEKGNSTTEPIIEACLKQIAKDCGTDTVKVDTANFNPARICKLYGTLAQKGANTAERPHRMAHIFQKEPGKVQPLETVQNLAALYQEETTDKGNTAKNTTTPAATAEPAKIKAASKFDMETWLNDHGIQHKAGQAYMGGTKYVLNECPFNADHKAPDSAVFVSADGACGFKCQHDSCKNYGWHDLRLKYEPDAYTKKATKEAPKEDSAKKEALPTEANPAPARTDLYIEHLMGDDMKRFKGGIYTGFKNVDEQQGDIYPGLYIIAAISSLGKTTWAMQIADNMAAAGNHVLFFSLEMSRMEMVTKSLARLTAQADMKTAVHSLQIRKGYYPPQVEAALKKYIKTAEMLSIIEGDFNYTVDDIAEYTKNYALYNNAQPVVFVDYLQVIQPAAEQYHQTIRESMDTTILTLKRLSRELNIPVIVISSLNRANYNTPVSYESLKETGMAEYSADVIWGLQLSALNEPIFDKDGQTKKKRDIIRKAKAENPRKIELVCLKNRFGKSSYSCEFEYYPAHDLFEAVEIRRTTTSKKKTGGN